MSEDIKGRPLVRTRGASHPDRPTPSFEGTVYAVRIDRLRVISPLAPSAPAAGERPPPESTPPPAGP